MKRWLLALLLPAAWSGCWVAGPATVAMYRQCKVLTDEAMRDRCEYDVTHSTNAENNAKLGELFRITNKEKCLAIAGQRDFLIERRFWPWEAADYTMADYLRRAMPKTGPLAWSEADISGVVAFAYQGPCLHCGKQDLLAWNDRFRRQVCQGLPPEPSRTAVTSDAAHQWINTMDKLYGDPK